MQHDHLIVKILIFILNFVLWASGILLIVFGSIALASPTTTINLLDLIHGVSNVTNLMNIMPFFEGVSIFMIVLGCLLFFFGGIGCCGALRMHRRMIMNYWIMLILAILCEIALIIYAAVFPPTENTYIQETLFSSLTTFFQPVSINQTSGAVTYSSNVQAASWELLQSQSQCCGAYGPGDFQNFTSWNITVAADGYPFATIPPTCCVNSVNGGNLTNINQIPGITAGCLGTPTGSPTLNSSNYYQTGCWFNVVSSLWEFDYIAIIICSCLIAAELLGIMLTVHVWHKMADGAI